MVPNTTGPHSVGIQLTPPPGPAVVEYAVRYIRFADAAPVAASNVLDALHKKYGAESWDEPVEIGWIFENTGKLVKPVPFRHETCSTGAAMLRLAGGDFRGGSSAANGKVVGTFNSDATYNSYPGFDPSSAQCTRYALAWAQFTHADPSSRVGSFYTAIQSTGLMHYSRALELAFIKNQDQNLLKQQDDAASKRAVPKL